MVSGIAGSDSVPDEVNTTMAKNEHRDEVANSRNCKDTNLDGNKTVAENFPRLNRPDTVRICAQLFIFKGKPNVWNERHVLTYFTSPDLPNYFHTVHAQREDASSDWVAAHLHGPQDWALDSTYLSHINCGAIIVLRGKEMALVNIASGISGSGRDQDWNCQNFVVEGLEEIVRQGFQTKEWLEFIMEEFMDKLLDGSVDAL